MRISLDVMPKERKVLKRDYFALAFCVLLLVQLSIYGAYTRHVYRGKRALVEVAGEGLTGELGNFSSEKQRLQSEISSLQTYRRNIDFINEAMAGKQVSWWRFFDNLERVATDKTWIQDLKQDENSIFHITGIARDAFHVTRLFRNMTRNPYYEDVFLNYTMDVTVDRNDFVEFHISFKAGGTG